MTTEERPYKLRYLVEPWDKQMEAEVLKEVSIGAVNLVAVKGNYGYTDKILIVSILDTEDGPDCFVMSEEKGGKYGLPSKERLLLARRAIGEALEHIEHMDTRN